MAIGRRWYEFVLSNHDSYRNVDAYLNEYCRSNGCHYISEGTGIGVIRTDAPLRSLRPRVRAATGVRLTDAVTCACDADMTAETGDDMARCNETALHLGKDGRLYCWHHLGKVGRE